MESNQNTNSSEYISGLPMGEGGGGQGAGDLQMEGEQIPPFFSSRSLILTLPKGIRGS